MILTLCLWQTAAQDKALKKAIELGQTDNKTMVWEDFLSNTIGGRPVGSHNLEDAEKWVEKMFRSWGMDVIVQEVGSIGVGFSRGPWSGRMLSADGMDLHFTTPGYTPGTKGPQRGIAVMEPKNRAEFERVKGTLKGAWMLLSKESTGWPVSLEGTVPTDSTLHYSEFAAAGVLGFIQSAKNPITTLYDRKGCFKLTMETLPTVCDIKLDERQFEVVKAKTLARERVILEFDIRNHFFEGPVKYHNVIGVIKGTKYPDEYVISGGHLDAYDAATGAIDDGQGVSVTMESARLLALSGAKPKRTMMFAIWTGEEYGLLGSRYFVEHNTVPMDKVSNYFNRDGGPEVAVSVTVPEAMYSDFEKIAEPVAALNPEFPFTVNKRKGEPGPRPKTAGGSDHAYFAMNGVPTVSLSLKDVKGYGFDYREIWHTDADLYPRTVPEYMEHSAIVNAVMMYGVANLDHLLSREGLYAEPKENK